MKHGIKICKIGGRARNALFNGLAKSLIKEEEITIPLPRAKALRPIVEKMVTLGKKAASTQSSDNAMSLMYRRLLISRLDGDILVAKKLCEELGQRYKDRKGGYLRILKTGFRQGDNAPMSVISFI